MNHYQLGIFRPRKKPPLRNVKKRFPASVGRLHARGQNIKLAESIRSGCFSPSSCRSGPLHFDHADAGAKPGFEVFVSASLPVPAPSRWRRPAPCRKNKYGRGYIRPTLKRCDHLDGECCFVNNPANRQSGARASAMMQTD